MQDARKETKRRVASALNIDSGLVGIEYQQAGPSGWVLWSRGVAAGTRFFAKVFLVDPYPVPPRFATPGEELARPEKQQRSVEEQIAAEWSMAQEMRSLVGGENIPAPLGCSLEYRILVFEEVDGLRMDCFVDSPWLNGQEARSAETAIRQAGAWLKTVHKSSFQGYETIKPLEVLGDLRALICRKELESTPYAHVMTEVLESACLDMNSQDSLRVPVALNHGDFSLPNLIWNRARQHLWVVDFELSARRGILHDLGTMIFTLRRPLLNPLTSRSAIRRWERAFWAGYGAVPTDLFAFANALATVRFFYHTLPKLRTWREKRGLWAGTKASIYTRLFELHLVQRILRVQSESQGTPYSRATCEESALRSSRGDEPRMDCFSRQRETHLQDQKDSRSEKGNA